MTRRTMVRAGLAVFVLAAALVASQAAVPTPVPVYAKAIGFSSGAAQSTIDVILSNPNPYSLSGSVTLQVVRDGIPRTFTFQRVELPSGNSFRRFVVPSAITDVRWVRVSNLGL